MVDTTQTPICAVDDCVNGADRHATKRGGPMRCRPRGFPGTESWHHSAWVARNGDLTPRPTEGDPACRFQGSHEGECELPEQVRNDGLGMGPDAPVVENKNGSRQSAIPTTFTTMPLRALWELAKLQKYGDDKYGPHNWRGVPQNDHIDHAFAHLMADRLGDISDDHLLHATWRLMAALEVRLFNERMDEMGEGDQ
jgi:Domain of unknown function (DUF5664)